MSRQTSTYKNQELEMIKFLKNYLGDLETKYNGGRGHFACLLAETALVESNIVTRVTCNELCEMIDTLLADPSMLGKNVWRDPQSSDQRILGFERFLTTLQLDELKLDECVSAVEEYLGYKIRSWTLMANKVQARYDGKGSGGGVHRDSAYRHQVKIIWYLSDVSLENGPFSYQSGTHFNAAHEPALRLGETRCDNVTLEKVVIGAAGTRLTCDTKCLHGGLPVEAEPRYAITLYTYPKSSGVKRLYEKSGLRYE
jgi:hypothetical protein